MLCTTLLLGFSALLLLFPDCSADLGLLVLRGLENPVPRSSDSDPSQPGSDSTVPVTTRCLPELQADHTRTICRGVPHIHAGKDPYNSRDITFPFSNPLIPVSLAFPRKSSLNQEVSPWQLWLSSGRPVALVSLLKNPDLSLLLKFSTHSSRCLHLFFF